MSLSRTEGPRRPKCMRCRHHGLVVPQKGHSKKCPYLQCSCWKCHLILERTRINALQRKLHRDTEHSAPGTRAGAPHTGHTGAPHTGNTGAAHTGNTGAAHTGNTGAPHTGAPHTGNTGAPHTGNTGAAHTGNTGAPHTGNTGAPHTGAPHTGNTGAAHSALEHPRPTTVSAKSAQGHDKAKAGSPSAESRDQSPEKAPWDPPPPPPLPPPPLPPPPLPHPLYWGGFRLAPLPLLHMPVQMPPLYPHCSNFLMNAPWSPVPPGLYKGSLSPLMVPPYPPAPLYPPHPDPGPPDSRAGFWPPAPPQSHHQEALDKEEDPEPYKRI